MYYTFISFATMIILRCSKYLVNVCITFRCARTEYTAPHAQDDGTGTGHDSAAVMPNYKQSTREMNNESDPISLYTRRLK